MNNQNNTKEHLTDRVQQGTEEAQQKVRAAGEQIQAQTKEVAEAARAKASELAGEAKETAQEMASQAKAQTTSALEAQKRRASSQVDNVASAFRRSGEDLRQHDQEALANYADIAAEQIESVSRYVQDKSMGAIARDVQGLARQYPELFVAGTLAAGFLLGRFLKSSQRTQRRNFQTDNPAARQASENYYYSRNRTYPPADTELAGHRQSSKPIAAYNEE